MSIFLLENGQLNAIQGTTFINESILERKHLQQALKQGRVKLEVRHKPPN